MISHKVKNMILNSEMTEDLLWEYLDVNFQETIVDVFDAFYELLISSDKQVLVDKLLLSLQLLAKKVDDEDNIKKFHVEVKKIIGNIYKKFGCEISPELKVVIRKLQDISKYLKQVMTNVDAEKKIAVMELLIIKNRNLKIVSGLIRDNKDILKIKNADGENILYRLLRRYSYLAEKDEQEINYLFQVISLFINNDDINIDIVRSVDYYLSALENKASKHVRQMIQQLRAKKNPISLKDLEKKYQVYTRYPSTIERELNTFKMVHNGAIDLIKQPFFTIDGEGSTCLDDAFYWERNRDGTYTLYVSITYIPSLIPYCSKMNRESIRRVETYYLVDGAYTLYPDYVSNYLASLLPNNVRYTETGIWLVEPDMTIVEDSFQLLKSTIKSRHRLTYEGADEIIGSKCHDGLGEMLTTLGTFALKQREKNKVKEVYRQQENVGSYNPNHESRLVDRLVSANIVQECSLLFGHSKARLAEMKGIPYIFRACDEQVKLDLDGSLLKKLSSDNQGCISRISAYYTNKPTKHCGLGYDVYCHGGSPARRSPDGQNQYIDEDLIFNPNPSDKMVYIWEERTKKLVEHFNEASQRIDAFSNQYNYLMGKKLIRRP